ncbi:MAG TPA: S-layer homology domain-containing protein, partial [Acidimicrobiia bacterium]|nr:S-layer homology domain-containing protein [Acidimicrobiia bacterium]
LDLFRGLNDQGELIPGILVGGEALSHPLNPNGFGSPASVELGLPRTDVDLLGEYPNCAGFVGSFVDDDESVFQTAIEWLALEGITKGCNPPVNDRFCPERTLSRGEMAAFLVRAMGYVDDGGGNRFIDDDASVFESAIDKLATAGVTQGCNPPVNDRFCPDDTVTRGQLAAFLKRALG